MTKNGNDMGFETREGLNFFKENINPFTSLPEFSSLPFTFGA
jgi:hypothetical protein